MRTGGGDRRLSITLPGGDRHVGHPPPLTPQLALGVRVAVMPGAQVVDGEIDDLRDARALAVDQQVKRRRKFHEARDDTPMDGRKQRVADVVLVGWQQEQQVIALTLAGDADQGRVGNQRQQWLVVAYGMGCIEAFTHVLRDHAPPSFRVLPKRMPPLISCPRRMNVPTTWQIGWLGSSW
ncbi:hypothetical protein D3C76_1046420 [compost metagenome]